MAQFKSGEPAGRQSALRHKKYSLQTSENVHRPAIQACTAVNTVSVEDGAFYLNDG
jgi:hypothetical protein